MRFRSDFYSELGVPNFSTIEVVTKSFKALARKYHPDLAGGDLARMQRLTHAYDILKRYKAQYDAWLHRHLNPPQQVIRIVYGGGWYGGSGTTTTNSTWY